MNFIKFPVSTTNIFPLANSAAGGQLLSEWNIRSRDMVGTDPDVTYDIGPSYAHGPDDFKLSLQEDNLGTAISSTELVLLPGKAVVNGHFIQSLTPIVIDMAAENARLQTLNQPPLVGDLGVGLKAFYSTESTMAGAMTVENSDMYTGIQVVILPIKELKSPSDVPTQEGAATCHLKLGKFNFSNSQINSIENFEEKLQYISSTRIVDMENGLSDVYITKTGLQPNYLYVFSGKSSGTTADTWCNATDSLIVWDNNPQTTSTAPIVPSAKFIQSADHETVQLLLPHKQVDGMLDGYGNPQYYADKVLDLPAASYADNTAGVVNQTYTKNIKTLASKLSNIYQLAKGKQVAYLDSLTTVSDLPKINTNWDIGDYVLVRQDYTLDSELDTYSAPSSLYAIVPGYVQGFSFYAVSEEDDDTVPASLTGVELEEVLVTSAPITKVSVADSLSSDQLHHLPTADGTATVILSETVEHIVTDSDLLNGAAESTSFVIDVGRPISLDHTKLYSTNPGFDASSTGISIDTNTNTITINRLSVGAESQSWAECGILAGDAIVVLLNDSSHPYSGTATVTSSITDSGHIVSSEVLNYASHLSPIAIYSYWQLTSSIFSDYSSFRGVPHKDYFVAKYEYTSPGDNNTEESHFIKYYFEVSSAFPKEWSGPIQLTGAVPLAQENVIGGFLNVPDGSDYADNGYVYVDETGHLRLRDYSLLRAGTLAYQLGEDIAEFGSGETLSSIQETLDEYVNDRIAFPSAAQIAQSSTPNVIEITINLSDDQPETNEDSGVRNLYIRNIDSRFNTCVYFHFTGTATSKTIINFIDCERIRIDSNVCGAALGAGSSGPVINVYRCGLYYDSAVLDYIKTCSRVYGTEFTYYDFQSESLQQELYPIGFTGMSDISLWYQKYANTDPNLTVDSMTIYGADVGAASDQIDFWSPLAPNDNHYSTALSSITFASDGTIIGCGLLISNQSSENIVLSDTIIASEFTLPQGLGLTYPASCMTRQLKITGAFTTAYNTAQGWYVTDSAFTALTPIYGSSTSTGSIAIHSKSVIIQSNLEGIPAWSSNSYNLFYGGVISANS